MAPPLHERAASEVALSGIVAIAVLLLQAAPAAPGASGPVSALDVQVRLDREHFSPGEIDGRAGSNTERALRAFQRAHGLEPTGQLDAPAWQALTAVAVPTIVHYATTPEDVAGPFEPMPADMMEKAELGRLGYASPLEQLAERFHTSPALLRRLNPQATFAQPSETIAVPNVRSLGLPEAVGRVVVDADDLSVTALAADGHVLARYPASVGSEHDPLPRGDWLVTGVAKEPPFHYNPDLFWDADPAHAKATLAPGPNNPVGVVWIALSREHYGIHGTPEPSRIGKGQSHGCIRLTNWDVSELAAAVAKGTQVLLFNAAEQQAQLGAAR